MIGAAAFIVSVAVSLQTLPPTQDTKHRKMAPSSEAGVLGIFKTGEFAPWLMTHVAPPSFDLSHRKLSSDPLTCTLKVAMLPRDATWSWGCWVMMGELPVFKADGP